MSKLSNTTAARSAAIPSLADFLDKAVKRSKVREWHDRLNDHVTGLHFFAECQQRNADRQMKLLSVCAVEIASRFKVLPPILLCELGSGDSIPETQEAIEKGAARLEKALNRASKAEKTALLRFAVAALLSARGGQIMAQHEAAFYSFLGEKNQFSGDRELQRQTFFAMLERNLSYRLEWKASGLTWDDMIDKEIAEAIQEAEARAARSKRARELAQITGNGFFAVFNDGSHVEISREQYLNEMRERSPSLSKQLGREDIAYITSQGTQKAETEAVAAR